MMLIRIVVGALLTGAALGRPAGLQSSLDDSPTQLPVNGIITSTTLGSPESSASSAPPVPPVPPPAQPPPQLSLPEAIPPPQLPPAIPSPPAQPPPQLSLPAAIPPPPPTSATSTTSVTRDQVPKTTFGTISAPRSETHVPDSSTRAGSRPSTPTSQSSQTQGLSKVTPSSSQSSSRTTTQNTGPTLPPLFDLLSRLRSSTVTGSSSTRPDVWSYLASRLTATSVSSAPRAYTTQPAGPAGSRPLNSWNTSPNVDSLSAWYTSTNLAGEPALSFEDEPINPKTASQTDEHSALPKNTPLSADSIHKEGQPTSSATTPARTGPTRPTPVRTTPAIFPPSTATSSASSRMTAKATSVAPRPSVAAGHGLSSWENKMKNPTFQIILSGVPDLKVDATSIQPNVDIYDIDMFMTETKTIQTLKRLNKTVICYFSAGTYEPGRPDSNNFALADRGNRLLNWPSEKWVKLSSPGVRRIISDRIHLAQQKGCDAIDPDNIDGYGERGGGFSLRKSDSIEYVRWLSETTKKYNMAVGLKNALEMLSDVKQYVHFAVNEECVRTNECIKYADFVHRDKKPVFHIEYPIIDIERTPSDRERKRYCAESSPSVLGVKFQSVIKLKKLDGWVVYCSGQVSKTPTIDKGGSRFSGRANYVIKANLTSEHGANPIEQNPLPAEAMDSAAYQAEIAKADGFPFAPGKGSEQFISDDELFSHALSADSQEQGSVELPQELAPEPSFEYEEDRGSEDRRKA